MDVRSDPLVYVIVLSSSSDSSRITISIAMPEDGIFLGQSRLNLSLFEMGHRYCGVFLEGCSARLGLCQWKRKFTLKV